MNENSNGSFYFLNIIFYSFCLLYLLILLNWSMFFTWSDQYFYTLYFNGLNNKSISDAFSFYRNTTGAREPVYFLLTYFCSKLNISKTTFDFLTSSLFFVSFFMFLLKHRIPKLLIAMLITSLYFFAIFFITERLKIGVFFLVLFFINFKSKYGYVFFFLALLSHAQLVILFPFFLQSKSQLIKTFSSRLNLSLSYLFIYSLLSIFLLACFYFLFDHIIDKISLTMNPSLSNTTKPLFFTVISYVLINKNQRLEFASLFLPILLVALLLGEGRITLIAFYSTLYFWFKSKKPFLITFLVFSSCAYLSIKGAILVTSASFYGDGNAFTIRDAIKYKFPQILDRSN